MNDEQCTDVLVVLNIDPNLEEAVIDWLLARDDGVGFTGFPIFGHSTDHGHLSPSEQVSGRARRQQFQIQVEQGNVERFLQAASAEFGESGVRYWVLPILTSGHLGAIRETFS